MTSPKPLDVYAPPAARIEEPSETDAERVRPSFPRLVAASAAAATMGCALTAFETQAITLAQALGLACYVPLLSFGPLVFFAIARWFHHRSSGLVLVCAATLWLLVGWAVSFGLALAAALLLVMGTIVFELDTFPGALEANLSAFATAFASVAIYVLFVAVTALRWAIHRVRKSSE